MLGTLVGLFILHRKQRDAERERRMQYWREQVRSESIFDLGGCSHISRTRFIKIYLKCEKLRERRLCLCPPDAVLGVLSMVVTQMSLICL